MTDDQIARAKRIAQHGDKAAKAMGLSEELRAIREKLATPDGVRKALAAMGPEAERTAKLMSAKPEPIKPPWERDRAVLPVTATRDSSPDFERLARVARDGMQAVERAKRQREQRMIETLEEMRVELVAAGRREAQATERAEAAEAKQLASQTRAEKRDAFMVKATVFSTVFGGLSLIAAVIAIIAS